MISRSWITRDKTLSSFVLLWPHLACSGLSLVSIDDQILWSPVTWFVHEGPLHTGGEPGTPSASQPGCLDLVDDPVRPLLHDLLGLVPLASLHGTLQPPVMATVNVSEDSVSVSHWAKFGLGLGCLNSKM